ncbi:hypothetical protein J3F84DRAFT_321875 [Trichoderma pleuroticola]
MEKGKSFLGEASFTHRQTNYVYKKKEWIQTTGQRDIWEFYESDRGHLEHASCTLYISGTLFFFLLVIYRGIGDGTYMGIHDTWTGPSLVLSIVIFHAGVFFLLFLLFFLSFFYVCYCFLRHEPHDSPRYFTFLVYMAGEKTEL